MESHSLTVGLILHAPDTHTRGWGRPEKTSHFTKVAIYDAIGACSLTSVVEAQYFRNSVQNKGMLEI